MEFINQIGDKNDYMVLTMFLLLFFFLNSFIRKSILRVLFAVLSSFFLIAQALSLFFTQSFVGYQFYVHFNLRGIVGLHNLFVPQIIIGAIAFVILIIINFYSYLLFSVLANYFKKIHKYSFLRLVRYLCLILLPAIIVFKSNFIDDSKTLLPLLTYKDVKSFRTILKKHNMSDYITPEKVECKAGKNIIVISMESIERAFLDTSFAHLTPNLLNLKDQWHYYDMMQNSGSGWTSGSLYTYLTGFPAYFGVHGNSIFQTAYHSSITSISHALNKANYTTIYLNGNTDHSGVKEMLSILKFEKIIDYKNADKLRHKSRYGIRDKDLFHIAKEEIEKVKESESPFALFISTTDTHFPNGIYDKRMESVISPQNSELEFTVASLDYLIGDFISFLIKKDVLKNTAVILFPDHLKMGDPSMFSETGERGLYIITNSSEIDAEHNDIYQIDLPKFILDASKVEHNIKFLTDYIHDDKEKFIKENILSLTEINTNGIINSEIDRFNSSNISKNFNDYKKDTSRFIAHAGGEIDGNRYTNSKESLDLNYDRGFRLFELDIILTSDGKFVAAHDWKYWAKIINYIGEIPVSQEQFLSQKIYGKYTPLDMDSINEWFKIHPDAILVTDKVNDPISFSELFIDKSRLIMELFSEKAVNEGLNAGILSPMPSQSLINGITKAEIEKMAEKGIRNIAISRHFIAKNKMILQEFKNYGIKPYVYHINFNSGIDELYVVKYEMDYIHGIYADKWTFE